MLFCRNLSIAFWEKSDIMKEKTEKMEENL